MEKTSWATEIQTFGNEEAPTAAEIPPVGLSGYLEDEACRHLRSNVIVSANHVGHEDAPKSLVSCGQPEAVRLKFWLEHPRLHCRFDNK